MGQLDQPGEFVQHRLVVALGGHPHIPGHGQDLDPAPLELIGDGGPFGLREAGVHRLLGVGAQLHSLVAVLGGQPDDLGHRQARNPEGGEGEFHVRVPSVVTCPCTVRTGARRARTPVGAVRFALGLAMR